MKLFVIVVFLLLALMGGLGIGYLIQIDTGYVRVSWSQWLLETNVWIGMLLLILIYLGIYVLLKTLGTTLAVKAGFMHWREQGTNKRALLRTNRGLLELAEGNWRKAERQLTRSAAQSSTPLVNYMAAAQAASEQGKHAQSDKLLEEARHKIEGSSFAVGLTQVQLQLARGQAEESLTNLKNLREQKPQHPMVLKLTKQALLQLEQWHELSELLPDLRKSKALDESELELLQQQVWSNSLTQASRRAKAEKPDEVYIKPLNEVWERMPSSLRKSADMMLKYTDELASLGDRSAAIAALEKHLRHDWNEQLVLLYGRIKGNPDAQLKSAENWLKVRRQDATLLLTLGRLAMRKQDWTKARGYFEDSLRLADSPQTCAELGRLMMHLETPTDASQYLLRAIDGSSALAELPEPPDAEQETSDGNDETARDTSADTGKTATG